jgi:cell division septum initiation protein DivIVA
MAEPRIPVTAEERQRMIAEAAYFRAERRGFVGGDPVQDWLEAEAEIDRMLAAGKAPLSATGQRQFEARLEEELKALEARIEELKVKASLARLELKSEFNRELETLEVLRNRLQARLEAVREGVEGAWEELRAGAEKAWDDLRTAVERVAARFK